MENYVLASIIATGYIVSKIGMLDANIRIIKKKIKKKKHV